MHYDPRSSMDPYLNPFESSDVEDSNLFAFWKHKEQGRPKGTCFLNIPGPNLAQGKILRKDDRDFDKVIIVHRMEVNTIHTVQLYMVHYSSDQAVINLK